MDSLPKEVVIEIFYATSPETRWALVFTCRGFYQLLNPLLYRRIELYAGGESLDQFSLFFSAVQHKDYLADHVRELKVFGSRPSNIWIEDSDENSTGIWFGEEWLTDYLYSQGSKQEQRDGKTVYFQTWDTRAVLALLLIRLKNLQSLKLGYAYWYDRIHLLGESNIRTTTFLRGWVRSIDTELFRNLLQLPLLEVLSCPVWDNLTQNEDMDSQLDFKPLEYPYSNVRCLHLPRSALHPTTINRILTRTPVLREFKYLQLIELDSNFVNTPINCEDMDKALKPVQNILEELTLGVHCKSLEDEGEEVLLPDVRGVIRSLANFTQLTNLKIYYRYLIDPDSEERTELVELLPPTLHVLKVTGTNSFTHDIFGEEMNYELLYDVLRQYVTKKATHAP